MINSMTVTDDYAHNVLDDFPIERLGGVVWSTQHGDLLASGNEKAQWYQLSRAGLIADGLAKDASVEEKTEVRHRLLERFYADFDTRDDLIAALDTANIASPFRGEHNTAVLAEWLDVDAAAASQLVEDGVLLAEDPA